MTSTQSLTCLLFSNSKDYKALALIKRVMTNLMEGIKPNDDDMVELGALYQQDPIMCTLDYQELQDFIKAKFK